jgi:predicted transcriptional regulator of viral defense system
MKRQYQSLRIFLASCVQEGRNSFCFEEAYAYHGGSKSSVQQALYRFVKANKLFSPKKDFFVIVPPEYQSTGSVPSLWFIDAYMNAMQCPYYVGLLSAAALLGAGHQQPQMLQVLTSKQMTPIHKKEARIQFYTINTIDNQLLVSHKTPYGYVRVSSPALTLIDLFRFPHASGYLNNIATVLVEIADQVNMRDLKMVLEHSKITYVQRLGYMSELLGLGKTEQLCEHFLLNQKRLKVVLLNHQVKKDDGNIDKKWKILINDTIETDI